MVLCWTGNKVCSTLISPEDWILPYIGILLVQVYNLFWLMLLVDSYNIAI